MKINFKLLNKIKEKNKVIIKRVTKSDRYRNRFLVLALALLFIFDYLIFCFNIEKNPFDIFPDIPVLDDTAIVNIYVPDIDGINILKEKRRISMMDEKKNLVRLLVKKIIIGSNKINTSMMVPVQLRIRDVKFYHDLCIIDLSSITSKEKVTVIKNSEELFRKAVEKTLIDNFPSVKKVLILRRGIPNLNIWDYGV